MAKTIQVVDGYISIVDGDRVIKQMALSLNDSVNHVESYVISIISGDTETIIPRGLNNIKGVFINSDVRVSLSANDGALVINGNSIYISSLNAENISITPLDVELDRGEVSEISTVEAVSVIKLTDKNYTYSKLVGSEVAAPIIISDADLLIGTSIYQLLEIEMFGIEDTGTSDVVTFFNTYLEDTYGEGIFELSYTDGSFVLTSGTVGAVFMEFKDDVMQGKLALGMQDSTLYYGTDSYVGKTVAVISGIDAGETAIITAIEGDTVTLDAEFENVVAGDMIRIYDLSTDADVEILIYD